MARLARLARLAYRDGALAEPDYYRVMFTAAIPGYTPPPDSIAYGRESLGVVAGAVGACVGAGVFRSVEPWPAAEVLFAAAHGAVSLELAGHLHGPEVAEARVRAVTAAAAASFLA